MKDSEKDIVKDWVWCTRYKGTRKLDFEPTDDVFFELYEICLNQPFAAWNILKKIWLIIDAEKIPIESDYFIGPMHDLVFNSGNEIHEEIVNFCKKNTVFLNNMLIYFTERDEIHKKLIR